jgi:Mrp family chromosome partitioning ATPase
MRRRRGRLPVLAEISGAREGGRPWALRRADFASLGAVLPKLGQRRVVLVTGGEESIAVAVGLAAAASAAGRLTLLLECDLANPRLAAAVGLAPTPGLHEYLRWEAEPADVLQPVVLGGPAAAGVADPLVCIAGGRPASKAETLIGLQSFSHMVGKLRTAYELVLIAGPPLAKSGPLFAVARQADAVVLALSASEASNREGREARDAVRRLPVPALGAIAVAPL